MKKKITKILAIIVSVMMLATIGLIAACNGYENGGVAIESVTISPSAAVSITLGTGEQTRQLNASVLPAGASQIVTWNSSNSAVATVSETGLVTAVGVGSTNITASAGGVISEAVVVTITPAITSISLTPATLNIVVGETAVADRTLSATSQPAEAPNPTTAQLTWTTSDSAVATVATTGIVTGVGNGTATITATLTANPTITATATVTVTTPPPTGLTLSQTIFELTDLDKGREIDINAITAPAAALNAVTWASSNENVATIVPVEGQVGTGRITVLGFGETTITATSAENTTLTATATLNVAQEVWIGIYTPADFRAIHHLIDMGNFNFFLGADIDFADEPMMPALGVLPGGRLATATSTGTFRGIFDGRGHTISNLTFGGNWYTGLFNRTFGATIQNVNFYNLVSNTVAGQGGLLIGHGQATIENVFLHGRINTTATGADWWMHNGMLAGYLQPGSTVRNVVIHPTGGNNMVALTMMNQTTNPYENVFIVNDNFRPMFDAGVFNRITGRDYSGAQAVFPVIHSTMGNHQVFSLTNLALPSTNENFVDFSALPAFWTREGTGLPRVGNLPFPGNITRPQVAHASIVAPLSTETGLDLVLSVLVDPLAVGIPYIMIGTTRHNHTSVDGRVYTFTIPAATHGGNALTITSVGGLSVPTSVSVRFGVTPGNGSWRTWNGEEGASTGAGGSLFPAANINMDADFTFGIRFTAAQGHAEIEHFRMYISIGGATPVRLIPHYFPTPETGNQDILFRIPANMITDSIVITSVIKDTRIISINPTEYIIEGAEVVNWRGWDGEASGAVTGSGAPGPMPTSGELGESIYFAIRNTSHAFTEGDTVRVYFTVAGGAEQYVVGNVISSSDDQAMLIAIDGTLVTGNIVFTRIVVNLTPETE